MNKSVLVTGGAGYIGSHMVRLLREKSISVVVLDNLSKGCREQVPHDVPFVLGDVCSESDLRQLFSQYSIDSVMHFAGWINISDSLAAPESYYMNNFIGGINLLKVMLEFQVNKIIFSSTAAVYGRNNISPINETGLIDAETPYGKTKHMFEQVLSDFHTAYGFQYVVLRYFNVAGVHPSIEIGPRGDCDSHLISNVMRTAVGFQDNFFINGDDYKTPDGTCIRDFIYVVDLCEAHLLAYEALKGGYKTGIFNVGTGTGYSVNEIITSTEQILEKNLPVSIGKRRPGDLPNVVADSTKIQTELKWKPKTELKVMLKTAYLWEQKKLTE